MSFEEMQEMQLEMLGEMEELVDLEAVEEQVEVEMRRMVVMMQEMGEMDLPVVLEEPVVETATD